MKAPSTKDRESLTDGDLVVQKAVLADTPEELMALDTTVQKAVCLIELQQLLLEHQCLGGDLMLSEQAVAGFCYISGDVVNSLNEGLASVFALQRSAPKTRKGGDSK